MSPDPSLKNLCLYHQKYVSPVVNVPLLTQTTPFKTYINQNIIKITVCMLGKTLILIGIKSLFRENKLRKNFQKLENIPNFLLTVCYNYNHKQLKLQF